MSCISDNQISLFQFYLETRSVMLGKTAACMYLWKDTRAQPVAEFKIWNWWDGINVSDLTVHIPYRKRGLSYQLLQYAVYKCGAKNIAVRKDNLIAIYVYLKFGFRVLDSDSSLYYMSI